MTYIFDDLHIAKVFIKSLYTPCVKIEGVVKYILIAEPPPTTDENKAFVKKYNTIKNASSVDAEISVDCIYYDDIIAQSTDPLRIFKYFTDYNCHDEYSIFSKNCKQYAEVVSWENLYRVIPETIKETKRDGTETEKEILNIMQYAGEESDA